MSPNDASYLFNKAFHAAAAYFALVSVYRNTQAIRSEWSHELKPKSQSPGTKAHTNTHVTGTAWAGLDSHGRYEKAAGLKQVRVYFYFRTVLAIRVT